MVDLRLRRRHRLRKKEIDSLASEFNEIIGCDTFNSNEMLETAEFGELKLVLLKGKPIAMYFDDIPFPTIYGLLQYQATKCFVTVDMGAVKFLANGADVMAPGVVDADQEVKKGMPVWIRDEKNKRALVIGVALMDASEMISASKGKAVKTHHYVGDKIWDIE